MHNAFRLFTLYKYLITSLPVGTHLPTYSNIQHIFQFHCFESQFSAIIVNPMIPMCNHSYLFIPSVFSFKDMSRKREMCKYTYLCKFLQTYVIILPYKRWISYHISDLPITLTVRQARLNHHYFPKSWNFRNSDWLFSTASFLVHI